MTATPTARAHPPRETWIDLIRGASIVLVIMFHALEFALKGVSPVAEHSWVIDAGYWINEAAGPFRLELMFLLSGLFVQRGLQKGRSRYLQGKLGNILYPFIVWSLISFALRLTGALVAKDEALDWTLVDRLAMGSSAATWFLYYLFVFYLITPLLRRARPVAVIAVCLALAIALPRGGAISPNFFYFFIYFFIGDQLVQRDIDLTRYTSRPALLLAAAALTGTVAIACLTDIHKTWPGYLPLVLASLPGLVWLACRAGGAWPTRALHFIGRQSIVFYVVHFHLFIALVFLLRPLIPRTDLLFLALLGSGLLVPWAMSLARYRHPTRAVERLFTAPPRTATADRMANA